MSDPLRVAVIGCGDIAPAYGRGITANPELALVGATDRNPPRVARFVDEWGGTAYGSIDELLADSEVEAVVNLTRQVSHVEVSGRCLRAGKHVYSEKPMALRYAECRELLAVAAEHGVRLASAPITYLGEAQRMAGDLVRAGSLGPVRVVYAEANWGQIERWHPRPQDFYRAGPTFDVGVYPLTLVTDYLGPAVSVRASGAILLEHRTTITGEPFAVERPDFVTAYVELAAGPVLRLTCSFYVDTASRQRGLEIHGDDAALLLDSWFYFDSPVQRVPRGGEPEAIQVPAGAEHAVDYSRGLADLAVAVRAGTPHRASGEHAAHVVEIVEAIEASLSTGARVPISSRFIPTTAVGA